MSIERLYPRYFQNNNDTEQLSTILARPTCFITDDALMQQLSCVEEWKHVSSSAESSIFTTKWLGVPIVVKWCNNAGDDNEACENSVQEVIMTASVNHPNIVSFFVASPSAIVLEQLGASLAFVLLRSPAPDISIRKRWCFDIISAIRYLHCFNVVHGDISIDNFVFDVQGQKLKLIDFAGAVMGPNVAPSVVRTEYLPLVPSTQPCFYNTDVYAMCCVLLQILFWKFDLFKVFDLPFFERHAMDAENKEEFMQQSQEHAKCYIIDQFGSCDITQRAKTLLLEAFTMQDTLGCDFLKALQNEFE